MHFDFLSQRDNVQRYNTEISSVTINILPYPASDTVNYCKCGLPQGSLQGTDPDQETLQAIKEHICLGFAVSIFVIKEHICLGFAVSIFVIKEHICLGFAVSIFVIKEYICLGFAVSLFFLSKSTSV